MLSERGDIRKAAKLLEAAWKEASHPDIAAAYLDARPGDSAQDRMARAVTLTKLRPADPEGVLALAGAAIHAHEFGKAREALRPLLAGGASVRACLLMAELEEAEHGAAGRVREWLARATRAPRDAAWVADGLVSDQWMPVSPISGRLDAFVWTVPPATLGSRADELDDVLADLDDPSAPLIEARAEASRVEPEPATIIPPKPETRPEPRPEPTPAKSVEPAPKPAVVEPVAATKPEPRPEPKPPAPVVIEHEPRPEAKAETGSESKPDSRPEPVARVADKPAEPAMAHSAANGVGRPKPVIFPVSHAPDDPGPDEVPAAEPDKKAKFRIFG
jgi:HemY protein